MVTVVQHRVGLARPYRRVPWSPRAWSQALYLAGGIPAQLFAVLLVLVPWWSLVTPSWGHALGHRNWGKVWPLPLLILVVVFLAVPLFTGIHRHRLRATAGVLIPPQPVMPDRLTVRGIVAAARAPATWRQLGYHLLAGPALAAAAIIAVGVWLAGVLFTLVYASPGSYPRGACSSAASRRRHPGTSRPCPTSRWTYS